VSTTRTRQNVYDYADPHTWDGDGPAVRFVGWFDPDAATRYSEGTRWNGNNNISLNTGSQWDHEALYRTVSGRWVLNSWSQREGSRERWYFVGPERAREWLLVNEYSSEDVEVATGEPVEPEMGRPVIGPQVKVRLTTETIAAVDGAAEAAGASRSAWIRAAVDAALTR